MDGLYRVGRSERRASSRRAGIRLRLARAKYRGGAYPLSHLYGYFGLVRLTRLGHDVSWTKA
jgi:hypothetical protein